MRRRALLSLFGVAAAGCVDRSASGGTPSDEPTETRDPTKTDPTRTGPATDSAATNGAPPDVGVPPSESDCPGGRRIARVVCVSEDAPATAPAAMTPDAFSGSLPEASFAFTLENATETRLNINFYAWRLWKRVDGDWFHVAPRGWPEPLHHLSPGESHDWSLTCRRDLPSSPRGLSSGGEDGGVVEGVGGGTYAFTTQGWFAGATYEAQTRFAVRFALDGPAVELGPTEGVTGSSRAGDTVTVRGDGGQAGEDARAAEFVLTRVDDGDGGDADGDDVRRLIPEQAARDYRLRNTLPFFGDGVERVRYVERNGAFPAFGVSEPYAIRYEGEQYRVTAGELGTETETG